LAEILRDIAVRHHLAARDEVDGIEHRTSERR
jgi:hypothetical protein